jgi:hypothetical protein
MERGQQPAPGTGPFRLKRDQALMEMDFGVEPLTEAALAGFLYVLGRQQLVLALRLAGEQEPFVGDPE